MMIEGGEEMPLAIPGLRLTEARVHAGLSLLQAADRLHLDIASVRALEAGDFAALGAVVFARGHLRRYAELLGLEPAEIQAACARAELPAPGPEPVRAAGRLQLALQHVSGVTMPPGAAVLAGAALLVVALVWWTLRAPRGARAVGAPSAASSPASVSPPDAAAQSEPADALANGLSANAPLGLGGPSATPPEVERHAAALGDPGAGTPAARFSADGGEPWLAPGGKSPPQAPVPAHAHTAPVPHP